MGELIQLNEICHKCHKKIDPKEERAYDDGNNRICLDCFFDPTDKSMICEIDPD